MTSNSGIQAYSICIEGEKFYAKDFQTNGKPSFVSKSDFHLSLYNFLKEWYSNSEYLTVQTSGSTGSPKPMQVEKQKMINSAHITCHFLDLQQGDTALLCMPLDYIAGKMMVIRSLVQGLDLHLVAPNSSPLKDVDIKIVFSAMTPMQIHSTLSNSTESEKLGQIEKLIIGGGSIDAELQNRLQKFTNTIYSTYGMTETLSHIALRKINGTDASDYYTPFESVSISRTEDDRLVIDAPLVSDELLYTNDIVDINSAGQFKILGRIDNVINSGGIKIQIEETEQLISPYIQGRFAISSIPDSKFGEAMVLVIQPDTIVDYPTLRNIEPPYYRPRRIFAIESIPLTETNKVRRQALKELVYSLFKNN